MAAEPVLEVEKVSQRFGSRLVLREVSLTIGHGEISCLLGPSGSGKSTLLKIIAGILHPTGGRILIHGADQREVPPYRRDIGFVFQSPSALFPHLNVFDNVAFPFRRGGRQPLRSEPWHDTVARMLQITGLQAHAESSIATLSGGELQRVALARALVYRPSLLLLDEPLSSLDNILKPQLTDLLLKLQAEFRTSVLYVTHDEREALQVATHVAIIDEQMIQQYDTVERVTRQPASARVAAIVGGWNIITARYISDPSPHIEFGTARIDTPRLELGGGNSVQVGLPVDSIRLSPVAEQTSATAYSIRGTVIRRIPWQGGWRYDCVVTPNPNDGDQHLQCLAPAVNSLEVGATASLTFAKEAARVFHRET